MNKHQSLLLIIMTLLSGNLYGAQLATIAKQQELKEAMQAVIGVKIALEQNVEVPGMTEAELGEVVEQYNLEVDNLIQEGVALSKEDRLHVEKWANALEAECIRLKVAALKI